MVELLTVPVLEPLTWLKHTQGGKNIKKCFSENLYSVTQTSFVTLLVTYSNKRTTRGRGISYHHLHHNKTHKYHSGHSASSVPSPKSTAPTPHTHTCMMKQSFPLLSHTHIYKQPSLKHSSNHTCKHSPPHTLMPCMASHSWLSEATVWAKSRVSYTWL